VVFTAEFAENAEEEQVEFGLNNGKKKIETADERG
jgi:hypothetical protein